jgi:hypothetical protein
MVVERDEWLLRREARISSLEKTISELEQTVRQREATIRDRERASNKEILHREATIREKEERITWLENQVRRLETPRAIPRTYDLTTRLRDVMSRLPGWCPEQKAVWMTGQILEREYKVAAEVGVYAGRSLFPIALAVAANGGRAVYAVDGWDNLVATSEPTNLQNDVWWDNADLAETKRQFLNEIILQNLSDTIKILEMSSQEAYYR